MQNDLFLRVLRNEPVPRTPLWIMRQAGRYLPEYLATRARAGDFMTLCSTPELACEVTLQPLDRFRLDAAILFSDILTVPDAMGLGLRFEQGEGPVFDRPVRNADDIRQLATPDPETELRYVMDATRLIRRELNGRVPLIGFCGSPWTVATYMVEGRSSKEYPHIKRLMYGDPDALHQLMDKITRVSIDYLCGQAEAGAQALMVFDTWGGILTEQSYQSFSLQYMQRICQALKAQYPDLPITLFTKLDHRACRCPSLHCRQSCFAGQYGSGRTVWQCRCDSHRGRQCTGQLRPRTQAYFQPWPRCSPAYRP